MLAFLFVDESAFEPDPADAAKLLDAEGRAIVQAVVRRPRRARDVGHAVDRGGASRPTLVDGLGLKPRIAFGPVRVAVTGRRISPPLFESLELLGRERSLEPAPQGRDGRPPDR